MEDDKLWLDLMSDWILHISTAPEQMDRFLQRDFRASVTESISDSLYLRGIPDRKVPDLTTRIWDCLFGETLFNTLLSDPRVTDIKFLSHNQIRIKCMGSRKPSRYHFQSKEQYIHVLEYHLLRNGLHFSGAQPMFRFYDAHSRKEDILCFHISSQRVTNANFPCLHLHRLPKQKKTLESLVTEGMLSLKAATQLRTQVTSGGSILFTGGDVVCQRTLLNAMLDLIPHDQSALAIQESEELFSLSHPEMMFQHTAPASRAMHPCDTRELMECGLLLDSDYFILDELTPENAFAFWKAATRGCRCWTCLPASDASSALLKMADFLSRESLAPRDTILASFRQFSCIICLDRKKLTTLSAVKEWNSHKQEFLFKNLLSC